MMDPKKEREYADEIPDDEEEAPSPYEPTYGEGGIWVRPASMWNETVERDGKVYKRFEKK